MKYCNNCQQMVEPKSQANTGATILLCCCCGLILGVVYYFASGKACPMCSSKNWGVRPIATNAQTLTSTSLPREESQSDIQFCPECGTSIEGDSRYCGACGKKF